MAAPADAQTGGVLAFRLVGWTHRSDQLSVKEG